MGIGAEAVTNQGHPSEPPVLAMVRGWVNDWRGIVQRVDRPGDLSSVVTLAECPHSHRRMSAAKECAEKMKAAL